MPTTDAVKSRNLSLQFNRLIPASSGEVFEAWTNPELMKAWFAPGNMTVPAMSRDLRPGGAFRIEMKGRLEAHCGEQPLGNDDPVIVAEGVYTRMVPGSRLAYTWAGSWNPAEQSNVSVSLFDVAAGTALTLDHDGIESEQSLQVHESGWQSSLGKLYGMFARN